MKRQVKSLSVPQSVSRYILEIPALGQRGTVSVDLIEKRVQWIYLSLISSQGDSLAAR